MNKETVFVGYKGEEFTMKPSTSIYGDDHECCHDSIHGITVTGEII